jgi:hypothetical protein
MSAPSFSKNIPDKIGNGIDVSGRNTLIKTEYNDHWRFAIADEPIDAKVDGKKMFCVRVDNAGRQPWMMIGFTPTETFESNEEAYFGWNGFAGCGMKLYCGSLRYRVNRRHWIIDGRISQIAKEIIAILEISNKGKKKVIRFLCDGNESKSCDASKHLEGDFLFPAICLGSVGQQITTIPIDQIKTRTPEIENLIKEYQQQPKNYMNIEEVKQARNDFRQQNEQMMSDFFNQLEQQTNMSDVVEVEVESKKENTKEKKVKQVATKKTKKETKPKTTKATKKKEVPKNNKEKKTKAESEEIK